MKHQLTILGMPALMGLMLTSLASAGNIGPNANAGNGNGGGTLPPACGFGGGFDGPPAYCNGPINGSTYAWTINFGFSVTDSFTLGSGAYLSSAQIAVWESPGDVGSSVDWSISTNPFGTGISSGTSSVSDTFLFTNQYGYNIDNWTFNLGFRPLFLDAGTYWLTLANASVPSGNPVFWDENSGPSSAQENYLGAIPSESFALYQPGSGNTPEPGTLVLGGSGLLLLAGALRCKLNRAAPIVGGSGKPNLA